ncbi:large ribosomal subunit protein bL12m [Ochotona princeps]|uniref:large ribosomal subunit protein bL12m n=1 Tax=Ochotona princeps TaxID=9978 RepID=UPI002714ECDB|nr:large ribosomal subunit protein bL12m [Ochotona princeps]
MRETRPPCGNEADALGEAGPAGSVREAARAACGADSGRRHDGGRAEPALQTRLRTEGAAAAPPRGTRTERRAPSAPAPRAPSAESASVPAGAACDLPTRSDAAGGRSPPVGVASGTARRRAPPCQVRWGALEGGGPAVAGHGAGARGRDLGRSARSSGLGPRATLDGPRGRRGRGQPALTLSWGGDRQPVPRVCAARLLCCSSRRRGEALAGAPLDNAPKEYPAKVQQLVRDIAGLTLLELSDLNELLKKTLKIQDVGAVLPGAAPVAAAPATEEAEEELPKQKERTHFTVRLTEAKPVDKVKLIKEIKNYIQGINLVQAKKLVESLPQEIKANVVKAEAEKIKAALEAVGGTVVLE